MARPGTALRPLNSSSGGGFSNIFPRPDYQNMSVERYFQAYDPGYPYYSQLAPETGNITEQLDPDSLQGSSGGIYNRIGRAYPDVSANGFNGAASI